ncbi:hypothetical protein JM658_16535 [Joostella atrarenae]|uniref:Abortive infection protein-like C-terminal domain-containing protein n=1 Tax=Joostella atrarenae TaxID=679257 RepID=A0ABS9J7N4_9FLAO|nr:hypothetical protein [Joostella atrarenae]MCF8716436.1 hypothetical protein [Joostella atrarenae]
MNWIQIYNRLFELINIQGDTYYGGTKFLNTIREVNNNVPSYINYIEQRRAENKSTSRRDYYFDLIMEKPENERIQIVNSILDTIGHIEPERTASIRDLIEPVNQLQVPQAEIPNNLWNADRLIDYLERMDTAINEGNYELALTLAYTCLEGFYKSFIREKIPDQINLNELTPMAVQIRNYLRNELDANNIEYPEQVIILISTVTNAVANARNNFSDSHSGNRAEKWVAIYIRDNVNSIVKMILNFI